MKLKFWVEHSTDCAYYHTSKVVDIPNELLGDLCDLNGDTDRIDGIEIVKENDE